MLNPHIPAQSPVPNPEFLTIAEVAGRMRISKMSVYRLVHNNELRAVRVGRSFRIPSQAVESYLAGNTTGPSDG